jgi:hypothetical protein
VISQRTSIRESISIVAEKRTSRGRVKAFLLKAPTLVFAVSDGQKDIEKHEEIQGKYNSADMYALGSVVREVLAQSTDEYVKKLYDKVSNISKGYSVVWAQAHNELIERGIITGVNTPKLLNDEKE